MVPKRKTVDVTSSVIIRVRNRVYKGMHVPLCTFVHFFAEIFGDYKKNTYICTMELVHEGESAWDIEKQKRIRIGLYESHILKKSLRR